MKLGVNVDHVATLRQARGTVYPDPVEAALCAQNAGCDSIIVHLREDRRHIQERDVIGVQRSIKIPLNLEMSVNENIVAFALEIKPYQATLVPERRQELTTEGGLDLIKNYKKTENAVKRLQDRGIKVSLFIDPDIAQIDAAKKMGVSIVEFTTGAYADAVSRTLQKKELTKLEKAVQRGIDRDFFIAVGHGVHYGNIKEIRSITGVREFNIGHAIICRSVFVGMRAAVKEMLVLLKQESSEKSGVKK